MGRLESRHRLAPARQGDGPLEIDRIRDRDPGGAKLLDRRLRIVDPEGDDGELVAALEQLPPARVLGRRIDR
jgi:hypothetical protein